jgi:beta-galactosidase
VGEARLAWNDDRGFAAEIIPGAGLHEVFGVREQDVWMRPQPELEVVFGVHPLTAGLEGALRGNLHVSTVTPLSPEARVLATVDGEPTIVASRYGAGETLFIGSYIGWGNHPVQHDANRTFIRRLADWAGVEPPVTTSLDGQLEQPVIVRLQENDTGYLLFLINHNPAAQDVTVAVRVPDGAYDLAELVTEREQRATARGGALQLQTRVGGQDVEVWAVTRR